MLRDTAIGLIRRAITMVETETPELAAAHMQVPLSYYRDETLAAKEKELFETSPLALVASCEIANPHDYLVRNALGRSILLTRDEDGVAHAFLNYCRHRGAEPAKGCGNARKFACPYHAWVYDTKGRLTGMPLRSRFRDLDLSAHGLVELPSEERHGFLWAVLTPDHPIDVAAHLGALDAEIASLGCDRMSYYSSLEEVQLETGWKSVAEGLLEGIHLPHVHPDTFGLNPQAWGVDLALSDLIGPHIRWAMPLFGKEGVDRLRNTPESEWEPSKEIGCIWLISPGMLLSHEMYGMIYADLTPGTNTAQSFLRYGWMSPVKEAPEGLPSPEQLAARAAKGVAQDAPVWEGCGRGLARGGHDYALIGKNERAVQFFHERLARQVGYNGLRYSS